MTNSVEVTILVKFRKTDKDCRSVTVRRCNEGLEYFHYTVNDWCTLPSDWRAKAEAELRRVEAMAAPEGEDNV